MRTLSPKDLDRLVRTHRNLKISALVTVLVMFGVMFLLIAAELSFSPACGIAVGVGLGALLLVPQQRLLAELGIDKDEAKAILQAERKRRRGGS